MFSLLLLLELATENKLFFFFQKGDKEKGKLFVHTSRK